MDAGVIDERAFLEQVYDLQAERERMFHHVLEKNPKGLTVCVFDGADRVQHMFFHTLDPTHPANQGRDVEGFERVILDMYQHLDRLVGRVREEIDDPRTVLLVMSDHGFCSFRRGVNLNTWLHQNGYLTLRTGRDGSGAWLADVDWERTRAYGLGLSGLFINLRGREASGRVGPGDELRELKAELIDRLTGLQDPAAGEAAINQAWDTATCFSGPYTHDGPDLLIGYNAGFRASWGGASGRVAAQVFEDNTRRWTGDHCVDPRLVPGVLFSNRRIDSGEPGILDIPPSILHLFGVEPPSYMQGRDLFDANSVPESTTASSTDDSH